MSASQPDDRREAIWRPDAQSIGASNLAELIRILDVPDYDALLALSQREPDRFWAATLQHLDIRFDRPYESFVDLSRGMAWPRFFVGGLFNLATECLRAPSGEHVPPALIFENEAGVELTLSYEQLARRTYAAAAGLTRLGVGVGDRVGLLMPNIPEAVISFLAISHLGAICVPLYSGFGPAPATDRLRDAGACCLLSADGFHRRGKAVLLGETVRQVAAQLPDLRSIVMVDVTGSTTKGLSAIPWGDFERSGAETRPPAAVTATDAPFMVMYTSGTTGKPKGAVHTHAGFPLRIAQDAAYLFDFKPGDRFMWVSDMGWMVGPLAIFASLLLKGTLVLYDGAPDQPDVGRLRATAGRHAVTHFGSAPTAIRGMASRPDVALSTPLPTLRMLMTAGEVIDPGAFKWFFDAFGGGKVPIINYTGGTEVSGAILTNVVLRPIVPGCFNSVAPGMTAGVIDVDGKRLIDSPGELALFAPFVGMTAGFWNDPQRYFDAYWSQLPDTWLHGDLAIEYPDGQWQLLGRSDDVMKISGKRVGPSELEAAVIDGQRIAEAFAVGVPDLASGEAIVLFVVAGPMHGDEPLARLASATLERAMGRPYRPKAVVAVARLPKTRNGKAVRRLARQAWLDEPAGNLAGLADVSIFDELVAACAKHRASVD